MNKTNTADARRTFRSRVEALITAASKNNLIGVQNTCSTVRMTASLAEELFTTAEPILGVTLTERHLDMLQLAGELTIAQRAQLGDASDDLAAGRLHTPAVRAMVSAFNARCGH
jgi:hypothetical protein